MIGRARARFGDTPELLMLFARQLLRRDAFAEAEEILAPLTDDADRSRASAAWAWIGVARLARKDRRGRADSGTRGACDRRSERGRVAHPEAPVTTSGEGTQSQRAG